MANSERKWQRARRPEQKEERRNAILEAAAELLDEEGLDGTGLNAIARRSQVSKTNVYRYFESREAILLRLLLTEADQWSRAFRRRLKQLEGSGEFAEIGKAFASTIAKRRRFCTLMGSLATVLEHNVGPEEVATFKREFLALATPTVAALESAVPAFTFEDAFSGLGMLVMAASGTWPHCHPSPAADEVLKQPEFSSMRMDFKQTMLDHATALLRGLAGP